MAGFISDHLGVWFGDAVVVVAAVGYQVAIETLDVAVTGEGVVPDERLGVVVDDLVESDGGPQGASLMRLAVIRCPDMVRLQKLLPGLQN